MISKYRRSILTMSNTEYFLQILYSRPKQFTGLFELPATWIFPSTMTCEFGAL